MRELDLGAYHGEERGSRFVVSVYDRYVIKRAKSRNNKPPLTVEQMHEIAKLQNEIAAKVDQVLPVEVLEVEGEVCMVMPRAPGTLLSKMNQTSRDRLNRQKEELKHVLKRAGFEARDVNAKNLVWDEEGKKLYFIDVHLCRRDRG